MSREYMTPEEVAERLAVSPKSVRAWLRSARLRGVKTGRLWRIREDDLNRFLFGPEEAKPEADEAEARRIAAVKAARGMFKHVPFSSEDLMREKQEELDREEQRWAERHGR